MALTKEDQERIRNRWQNRNSGNATTAKETTSVGTSLLSDKDKSRIQERWNKRFDVDDAYINTFISDANTFLNQVQAEYGKLESNPATSESSQAYYDSMRKTEDDLSNRAWRIKNFLNTRKEDIDEETYTSMSAFLDNFSSGGYSQIFHPHARYTKAYTGKTTSELDEILANLEDGEEKEWLTSYRGAVDYEEKSKYDLSAGAQEIEELEHAYEEMATISTQYFHITNYPDKFSPDEREEITTKYNALVSKYGSPEELHETLRKKKQYQEDAKYIQDVNKMSAVTGNADFTQNSQYISNVEYGLGGKPSFTDKTYAYVNNPTVEDKRIGGGETPARELIDFDQNIFTRDTIFRNRETSYQRDALDQITEDEVKIYNYYYATEGKEKAEEYLNLLVQTFKERKLAEAFTKAYKVGSDHPILGSVLSVGTSLGSGFEYIEDIIQYGADKLVGKDAKIDINELAMTTNAIRGAVSEKVDLEIGNWDAFDFLYNTTMSGVDSLASAAFGGVGGVILGLSAAAQGTNDALDRGMSDGQAFWNGLFSGVFEGLFESVSIGNFNKLKEIAPNGVKDIIKNLGKSMLVNASEETLTEIANIAYDTLVNGEFANYTLEELRGGAWKQALGQVIEAGASGALMGMGMSTVGSAIGNAKANRKAKAEYGSKTDTLIQQGLQNNVNTESYKLATKYQQKVDGKDGKKGKSLTGKQIRNLLAANKDAITAKDMKKIQQAAEKRLTELGQTENVSKIAELATKYATGHDLTRSERSLLANSEYGSKVASELLPKNVLTDLESSEWARSIGTESVNKLAYNIKSILEEMASMEDPAAYKSLEDRVGTESSFKVSEDGQATDSKTGDTIDLSKAKVAEFVKDGDGNIVDMVIEVDGKQVKASEVDYADGNQSYLFETVSKIENITPRTATSIIQTYDPASGQTAGEYLNGVDEAYTYGYHNYSEADMKAGKFAPKLTETQMKSAYVLGQNERSKSDAGKADNFKRMRTAAEAQAEKAAAEGKEAPKAKNLTVTYDRGNGDVVSIDKAGIRDAKRSGAVEVAKILHKLGLGTKVEFFSSYLSKTMKDEKGNAVRVFLDENGAERAAPSGVYRKGDGTIRVDLNAYNGRGLTLNALSHELTHFIQQWSDAKYKVLADFLIKAYEKTDMTMHERVLREQARLEGIRKEAVSYDEAFDEVVANAMSKMLDDGKLVERLTELKAQDEKLARKLWQGFKKILAKFLGVYENAGPLFQDTADLMAMKETFEQLQNMFAEAMVEASENYQASLTVAESQTLAESSKEAGTQQSSQKTDLDKDFDYSDLNWATDLGIITTKDKAIFERTINNEIFRGAEPQSANGEYIIDTGKCLMFTDGDFHNPTLSRVIVFATEYESLTDEAKRRILYEAKSTGNVQVSQRIIENLYGPGFAVEYTPEVHGANAGQNGRGKRTNGKGSNQGYRAKSLKERLAEEGLSHLLEDDEAYSSQETDLDSEGKKLTKEQLEYFKDSKARDENGNLKVVYHGTRKADFTVFKRNVTYFTDNKEMADSYSPNGDMYEGYLDIKKPYEIDAQGEKWSRIPIDDATKKFLQEYGAGVFKEGGKWRTSPADIVSAIEEAVENGDMDYDGIIIKNIDDTGSYYKDKDNHVATDYIVFNSNQFKNVDNKTPTSNPDIRYSSQETDADADKEKVYSYEGLPADAFYKNADIYNYDFLVNQKPMVIVDNVPLLSAVQTDGKIDYDKAVKLGLKNVAENGGTKQGDVYLLENSYTGRPLQISKGSITHGIGAESVPAKRTNARLGAVIGQICKNAIPINGVENTHNVRGTYVMASLIDTTIGNENKLIVALVTVEQQNGLVQSIEHLDVTHSVSGRKLNDQTIEKENRAALSPRAGTKSDSESQFSVISIRDFLGIVNSTHQGYLSDDVIKKLNVERRGPKKGLFSTHETDYSNRSLLANAFEGLSKSSIEYKMIQDYKEQIKVLNLLDEQLSDLNAEIHEIRFTKGKYDAKKLQKLEEKAERMARDINKQDKVLIRMEASEPLRKIIEFERKKAAQKTKEHIAEIQQNKKDRAEQTELRHKIRKTIRDLDKLLNRGNKKLNVKEDMQGFVSKALELADYLFTDHISNDELIRRGITVRMTSQEAALVKETEDILTKLYDEADSLTDEEFTQLDAKRKANETKLRDLLTAQRNERLSTPVYNLFNDLVTEYASLKNSAQEAVKGAYDPKVEEFLRSYLGETTDGTDSDRKTLLQNMRLADMTTEELWKLHNAYTMVLHSVRTANKLFVNGKTESLEQMANRIVADFSQRKAPNGKAKTVIRNLSNKLGWDYEKLHYALDRIGSEAFTELVMNLANSENIVMEDVKEAKAFLREIVQKYDFNDWDYSKEIDRDFLDTTGKKFRMTLGQLMSLYAYSRREGAWDHIEYGGFVFGETALTNPKPADSYKLSKDQCEAITNTLTKEQKAYVEDMQKFLSETMGAKGNEVSMLLYGIKMFGEKNYFPIHIAGQFKAQANESQAKAAAGFGTMSNAGFTHAQNPNAKAPFVLEGFNEIWADHVNEMSRYHGAVPALEDMRRVMNRSSYSEAEADSMAIKQLMENSFGKEAVEYFDSLYREANSGAIADRMQRGPKKLLSLFRKNSVAYSLSVVIQQPSAMARAYAMIDKKYFGFKGVGALTSGVAKAVTSKWNPAYVNTYNEMLKYAPGVTMAKEIGGFDTHTGSSIREYLLDTEKSFKQSMKTENLKGKGKAVLDLVDDNAIANLPNVADKIAWIEIWNACKRETIAKHKDLAANSEEFMQAVGERFTEVIRATQVYDSIFAKSPLLKSKYIGVQYLVSFMNEPNTTANMVEKAVRDAAKGDWKGGLRIAGAVTYSIIFNNVLKAIVYAMRDDDEDETYIEKYMAAVTGGLIDDFLPMNYIPVVRDVWSKVRGFDVERPDMAIVTDAIDAIQALVKVKGKDTEGMTEEELAELDKKLTEANWKLVGSLAAFFGIPVKNVYREVEGIINQIRIASKNAGMTTPDSLWDKVKEEIADTIPFGTKEAKTDKLYGAIISGDRKYLERIKGTYKTEDAYLSAVRKALRENDPRIHEAAQARVDGNTEEYKRIFREIQKEGKFSFDDIMSAINSEESKIRKGVDPEKATSDYTANGYVEAIAMGNTTEAMAMKDDIIATKVANGKTQEEAEKEFKSSVATGIGEAYSSGLLDEAQAEKMLMEYAGKDEEEAASKVSYWSFCEDNPAYKDVFTESHVAKYHEFAEPANVSVDVYAQFISGTKGIADIKDEWGDVEVTKREQVLEVIDSLPLTWEQKDALYLAAGYAESKIWDVPW